MFSVIMPLYNKAPYVEKAIQSVLAQTCQEFELIVVDDGSKDNSLEIVQRFKNSKIQIVQQENAGVSMARNNGVKLAKYDYVAFLDADDWWDIHFLEEMKALIMDFPEGAMYASSYFRVKNCKNIPAKIGVPVGFERGYFDYIKAYAASPSMPVWTGAVIIKKTAFNKVGGFKPLLKLGEDFDLWIRIALKYKAVLLNKPLAYYNQDVETTNRAIGKVYDIKHNYLWDMDYLAEEEAKNKDLKKVLDNTRTKSVRRYFLTDKYREQAREILNKVDWSNQPPKLHKRYYKTPIWWLKLNLISNQLILNIKNTILKHIRK